MSDTLEYIEAYFQQTLSEDEQRRFEEQCRTDEQFAQEVAFYVTARQATRNALLQQKEQQWKQEVPGNHEGKVIPMRKPVFRAWMWYAAAACVILFIAGTLFFQPHRPERLAGKYLQDHYSELSLLMAPTDSMQMGRDAYNQHDYQKAASIFADISKRDSANFDAVKYTGLSYLQLQEYDSALQKFNELAANKDLRYNSGNLLKAITLLQRNRQGDEEQAKQLLETITSEKKGDYKAAQDLLKAW